MFTLEKSIGLFVPSTEDKERPISSSHLDRRVESVSSKFAELFGGYHAFYSGIGGYTASNGDLIKEDSILVVAFCTDDAYCDHYSRILTYASLQCHLWYQETIAILDNWQKIHLISESDHIGNVTRSICKFETYHHLLITEGNVTRENSQKFYNNGYTIALALHEDKSKNLAIV